MSEPDTFRDFYYKTSDGLNLHAQIYGETSSRIPVICLPGLTRNARDFHEIALLLSQGPDARQIIAFDYRGRGLSDYDADYKKYNVGVEAGDILAGMAALGIPRAHFIGTSRGGLIIHVLGAIKPDVIASAVLNDIGPVLETSGLQAIKDYLGKAPRPKTMPEAVAAQKLAHGAAFTALGDAEWERMAHAIFREKDGRLVPDFDPKLLTDLMSTDLSQPLPDLWPQFAALGGVPLLVIRGANSLLLSAATVDEMKRRHPNLEAATVAGQGHAPFLEMGDLPGRIQGLFSRAAA